MEWRWARALTLALIPARLELARRPGGKGTYYWSFVPVRQSRFIDLTAPRGRLPESRRNGETVSLLDRPMYSLAEAARLLRVSPSRLRWWLEGAVRGEKRYPPVLRSEPTGDSRVSWGEFIEAAYLREYRAHLPLQRLRPLREMLCREFDTRFPFAISKPLIAGQQLVSDMQAKLGIPEGLWMVVGSGQLMLSGAARTFCSRVQFDPATEEAMRYIVMEAEESVYVDPRLSFGIPTVRGVRTEVITELSLAGEPRSAIIDIYRDYGITEQNISTAIDFETRFLKAA